MMTRMNRPRWINTWRNLMALALLGMTCQSAHAAFFRIDYTGIADVVHGGGVAPPVDPGATIRWGFTIDTSSASGSYQFGLDGQSSQLTHFSISYLVSDFRLMADDRLLLGFDGPAPGGSLSGSQFSTIYDGVLRFTDGNRDLFYDIGATVQPLMSAAQFAALADPFADLLSSMQATTESGLKFTINSVSGEWGLFRTIPTSISVQSVPEPTTLALWSMSLAVLFVWRRRARTASQS